MLIELGGGAEAPGPGWNGRALAETVERLAARGAARIVVPELPPADAAGAAALRDAFAAAGNVYLGRDGGRTPPAVLAAARGNGFIVVEPDPDGIWRTVRLWRLDGGAMLPALPLAVLLDERRTGHAVPALPQQTAHLTGAAVFPRLGARELDIPEDANQPSAEESAAGTTGDDRTGTTGEPGAGGDGAKAIAASTVYLGARLGPAADAGGGVALADGSLLDPLAAHATAHAALAGGRYLRQPVWAAALPWLSVGVIGTGLLFWLRRPRRPPLWLVSAAAGVLLVAAELGFARFAAVRIDMGRPLLVLTATALACAWLARRGRGASPPDRRAVALLGQGRLEAAFAALREAGSPPAEHLLPALYKLALAFDRRRQPERAQEVFSFIASGIGVPPIVAPEAPPEGVPARLGRYVIERELGSGAMGSVFLGRDPRINRPVALKVVALEQEFDEHSLDEARTRFFQEAESVGRLNHPDIVTVFDAGEDQGLAYIAMEYVTGEQLLHHTARGELLPPALAIELAARTADALAYAHAQRVVHRDVKPANLIYDAAADSLKVNDFGVARLTDVSRTRTGIVLGTPTYMSPEQFNGDPVTGRSDLFSLGVTLYELLTGSVPFRSDSMAGLMASIANDKPLPVTRLCPALPGCIDEILERALAKIPDERYPSGGEMADALRQCAARISREHHEPVPEIDLHR